MTRRATRRQFLQQTSAAAAGFWVAGGLTPRAYSRDANDAINIAFVGVGGMGGGNLNHISRCPGVNVVALCDIDGKTLDKAAGEHAKAEKYSDYRKMMEEVKNIDAVVVSTPDHNHAMASLMAMKLGKHCYCEKPLTYSVHEARAMRKVSAEKKLITQMGNRGTASDGFRTNVEVVRAGTVGPITEVHVWTNRPIWPQGMKERPKAENEPPKHLNWDCWIGPAQERPYAGPLEPGKRGPYHDFNWRGWIDFGTGALGDMACHTANMAFMGLKLGYPTSVVAEGDNVNNETYPSRMTATYQFPERGEGFPAVKWVWYDGKIDGKGNLPPAELLKGIDKPSGSGSLLIGKKGKIYSPSDYGSEIVVLDHDGKKMDYTKPEKTLDRAQGQNHYLEWVLGMQGKSKTLSNFDYAAFLTEVVVLGNVALRVGKKIEWDGEGMKATNCPEAAQFVTREYRKGWSL